MNRFEALHIINRKAKYHKNQSKVTNRIRMDALYKLKHRCINQWADDFERVEKHIINQRTYYCFYSPIWSYHIPEDDLILDEYTDLDPIYINDFKPKTYNDIDYTTKSALLYLYEKHSLNANNFISSEYNKNYEWYYLPSSK